MTRSPPGTADVQRAVAAGASRAGVVVLVFLLLLALDPMRALADPAPAEPPEPGDARAASAGEDPEDPPEPAVPRRPASRDARHVALFAGYSLSLGMDLDYGLLYGFANLHVPAVVGCAAVRLACVPFSAGFGLNYAFGRGWKFELFLLYAMLVRHEAGPEQLIGPVTVEQGLGLGVGFHYTARSGLTLGFKLPVLGVTVFDDPDANGSPVLFYWPAFTTLPLAYLGYRFLGP